MDDRHDRVNAREHVLGKNGASEGLARSPHETDNRNMTSYLTAL
jgi:hypothetical protein